MLLRIVIILQACSLVAFAETAECTSTTPQELQGASERLRALAPPEEALTFFVSDASAVFVLVRPLSQNVKRIRILLDAKDEPAGAFAEVCDAGLAAYTHNDTKVVKAQRSESAQRWRIQIKNPEKVGLGVVVYAQAAPTQSSRYLPALDFVCIDRRAWTDAPALSAAFFQDVAPVFRIEDVAGVLSPEALGRINREFVSAVAGWNIAARSTGLGMVVASVITTNARQDFINSRLAGYLTAFPDFDPRNTIAIAAYRDVDMDLALASRVPGSSAWIDSSALTPLSQELKIKFCAVDPRVFFGDEFRRAQRLICGADDARPALTIRLVEKLSPIERCSGSVAFGCELGNGRAIELNVRDFTFKSHDEKAALFGRGDESVDMLLVSLHELGHLLGLEHDDLDGAQTIMDPFPAALSCLDNTVRGALAQAQGRSRTMPGRGVAPARQ